MTKTIRPGLSAYVPLGLIAGGIVLLWVFVWIYRGPQTGAWQPIALVVGLYVLWCLALWRRVLTIDEDGLLCTYLLRRPRRVLWSDIQRSEIMLWIDRKPYQIIVYGASHDKPLLDIPLRLYAASDVDFLMGLGKLKIRNNTASR